jgi:hypothetical protein
MSDYEQRIVVLWDLGGIEEFPYREAAQDELNAMESRGCRGTIYTDATDALRTFLTRERWDWTFVSTWADVVEGLEDSYGFFLGEANDWALVVLEPDNQPIVIQLCRSAVDADGKRELQPPTMVGQMHDLPCLLTHIKNCHEAPKK